MSKSKAANLRPDILCRYFDGTGLVKTLDTMSLRFNRAENMNDLYDCRPPFKWSDDFKTDDIIVNKYKNTPQGFLYCTTEKVHILSFSELKDSILMWGHYTQNFKGGVICFKNSLSHFKDIKKVDYIKTFQTIPSYLYHFLGLERNLSSEEKKITKDVLNKLYHSKYKDWQYEKEQRLIAFTDYDGTTDEGFTYKDGFLSMPFTVNDIEEICIGNEMSMTNKLYLFFAINKNNINVPIYKIDRNIEVYKLEKNNFSLDLNRIIAQGDTSEDIESIESITKLEKLLSKANKQFGHLEEQIYKNLLNKLKEIKETKEKLLKMWR